MTGKRYKKLIKDYSGVPDALKGMGIVGGFGDGRLFMLGSLNKIKKGNLIKKAVKTELYIAESNIEIKGMAKI